LSCPKWLYTPAMKDKYYIWAIFEEGSCTEMQDDRSDLLYIMTSRHTSTMLSDELANRAVQLKISSTKWKFKDPLLHSSACPE